MAACLTLPAAEHAEKLKAIARGSAWFMHALRAARSLGLPSWCIGAGAVRNLVWDHLHDYATPSDLADIDLAYFDAQELPEEETRHQEIIAHACPGLPWEVTNQAHVHLWFEKYFGYPVTPLHSLAEAVATWPEFATSVGISLDENDALHIIAPWGLDDLFEMRVRRNPVRVSEETFLSRTRSKRYMERWPKVRVL